MPHKVFKKGKALHFKHGILGKVWPTQYNDDDKKKENEKEEEKSTK